MMLSQLPKENLKKEKKGKEKPWILTAAELWSSDCVWLGEAAGGEEKGEKRWKSGFERERLNVTDDRDRLPFHGKKFIGSEWLEDIQIRKKKNPKVKGVEILYQNIPKVWNAKACFSVEDISFLTHEGGPQPWFLFGSKANEN